MEDIIKILHEGNYSCVIKNDSEIRTFSQRGVADLYELVKNEPSFLNGASVADKVIGKAAATLMIVGGVKDVYTDIISLSALVLLREAGIEPKFGKTVPFIQNRNQTDWCPMEKICYNKDSAETIILLIEDFICKMRLNNNPQNLVTKQEIQK